MHFNPHAAVPLATNHPSTPGSLFSGGIDPRITGSGHTQPPESTPSCRTDPILRFFLRQRRVPNTSDLSARAVSPEGPATPTSPSSCAYYTEGALPTIMPKT